MGTRQTSLNTRDAESDHIMNISEPMDETGQVRIALEKWLALVSQETPPDELLEATLEAEDRLAAFRLWLETK